MWDVTEMMHKIFHPLIFFHFPYLKNTVMPNQETLALALGTLHAINLLIVSTCFLEVEEHESIFCQLYLWSSVGYSYGQILDVTNHMATWEDNNHYHHHNPVNTLGPALMVIGALITRGTEKCEHAHLEDYVKYTWYTYALIPTCITLLATTIASWSCLVAMYNCFSCLFKTCFPPTHEYHSISTPPLVTPRGPTAQ